MPGLSTYSQIQILTSDRTLQQSIFDEAMVRPLLADERVRFVGEPIAAIVADSPTAARDAAELVEVDYVSLDAVVDPETALNAEVLLFDDTAEGNVVCRMEAEGLVADFESCEVVTEVRTVNNRLAPAPVRLVPRRLDGATTGDFTVITLGGAPGSCSHRFHSRR